MSSSALITSANSSNARSPLATWQVCWRVSECGGSVEVVVVVELVVLVAVVMVVVSDSRGGD